MQVTVSNWAGSPIERAGIVFPPRRELTADGDPARLDEIRGCRSLELHGDTPDTPLVVHACGQCDFVAKTAGGLKAHRRAKHEEKNEGEDEPAGLWIPHDQRESSPDADEQDGPEDGSEE